MVNRFLNSYKHLVFPVSVDLCSEIMKVFTTLSLLWAAFLPNCTLHGACANEQMK